jgi:ubiquitin C-terminal hydrolase
MVFPLKRASAHFDNSKNLTLAQLLEHFQKKRNFVPGLCPICKKKEPYVRQIKIEKPPKIFICSIDREESENDIVIDIPEQFDISKFLCSGKKVFNLVGVIYRLFENGESFYSCIVKENNQYFYYNEGKKQKCNFNDIKSKGIAKIIIYQE